MISFQRQRCLLLTSAFPIPDWRIHNPQYFCYKQSERAAGMLLTCFCFCLRSFSGVSLLAATSLFKVGWRVGMWLSVPFRGLRKLRPQVELQHTIEGVQGESLGNGAETTRPPRLGDETSVMSSALEWNGETAVLQVERANSR